MNIGDLILSLIADGSKLTPQVEQEAAKAGDAGAKTLTQRMSAGLKGGGIQKVSAALAVVTAGVAKGSMDMEDQTARFASATGSSLDESKKVMEGINRIAGDQQQSLASVTDAAILVKRDMGLVGDEATAMTEKIVKFARVTGITATDAVKGLDDVTDSWGLTTKDTSVVMDKMIVSQQKFGGSIQDNIGTLSALAPAMRAANMTVDDGIALLGLFGSKGLDAGQASAAFAKALTKVKSPAELQKLIDDISNTQDPFQRAAKAADLFGAKAGAKLANALGGVHLDDYKIGMDEAANATNHAADVLDSSFGARFRKLMSQASAALRGFGADFGPVLTSVASLGLLANALGVKLPLGAFKKLGTKLGSAIATGIGGAIVGKAGEGIVADAVANEVEGAASSGKLKAAASKLGDFVGDLAGTRLGGKLASALSAAAPLAAAAFSAATTAALVAAPVIVAWAFSTIPTDKRTRPGANTLDSGAMLFAPPKIDEEGLKASLATIDWGKVAADMTAVSKPAWDHAGQEMVGAVSDGAQAAAPKAMASMGSTLAAEMKSHGKAWINSAHAVAMRAMGAVAQGITDARQKPLDAMSQLIDMLKHPLKPMGEVAKLFGQLISGQLQKGLHSKDPAIRAQAEYTKQLIIDRLTELNSQTGPLSRKAAEAVRKGLKSKDPDIRAAAQRLANRLPEAIRNKTPAAGKAARDMGATAAWNLKAGFGTPTVTLTIKSVFDERGGHRAIGGPVMAGTPYWVNEHTANSELFVPSTSGRILTHAEAVAAAAGGGGDTFQITVQAGNDVSPQRARLFGQLVADEVGHALRQQRRRTVGG